MQDRFCREFCAQFEDTQENKLVYTGAFTCAARSRQHLRGSHARDSRADQSARAALRRLCASGSLSLLTEHTTGFVRRLSM